MFIGSTKYHIHNMNSSKLFLFSLITFVSTSILEGKKDGVYPYGEHTMISPVMQSAVSSNALIFHKRVRKNREELSWWMLRFEGCKMSSFLIEFTMVSFPKVSP